MKIKKMTATFGGLDNAVLEPGDGLTVITAPNEAGKSTWAGFWKAMLYGVNTKERERADFLPDKTRCQPWSGAPMAGEIQVEWQGRDITIRRFPTRANPFGGFEAVYTASGDPVPDLTAANIGEQLTGVSRDVYLRSAFVGQGGAVIGASGELEARISALATSGQEDVAYSTVERTLKDWRNRRRANRASGLIPQLEEKESSLDAVLREMDEARRRKAEAEQELDRLQEKDRDLQGSLNIWARIERHRLNRRYAEAYMEWAQAKAAIPEDKTHPIFGAMTGEEAWAFAREKLRERQAAEEENRRQDLLRVEAGKQYRQGRLEMIAGGILGVCMLLIFAAQLLNGSWLIAALCAAAALVCVYALLHGRKLAGRAQDKQNAFQPIPIPKTGDLLSQAAEYREELARAAQAKATEAAARRRVNDLAAQGGRLADTLELLYPPAQSKTAIAAQLAAVERELARTRDELSRIEGALAHMGGTEDVSVRRAELDGQLAQRLEEYDALTIALDALSAANAALRERFSPALNREAGTIFAALTGGRWGKLALARDFTAQALQDDGLLPRSWLALSAGTAEQLYLAVRLAICRLTMPEAPMVLDDVLAAFDGERCALALDYLREAARDRQILLFSCHSREADWAKTHGIPVIYLKTHF